MASELRVGIDENLLVNSQITFYPFAIFKLGKMNQVNVKLAMKEMSAQTETHDTTLYPIQGMNG
jgi:hypothetical protein